MHGQGDFAFIQTAPGRVFVGWGPFEQLPFRRPDRPAFFISDFFLDDPHPWRHPAQWEEIGIEELASRFPKVAQPQIGWEPPRLEEFSALFTSARVAMARGDFKKIVPVIFEGGELAGDPDIRGYLIAQLAAAPADVWAYGFSHQSQGMVGATPEVLFRSDGRGYLTMALAGTQPLDRAVELLRDPKELREHRLVVDDIVRRLAPFGNVEVDVLRVLELPRIAHLATPIRFEESGGEKMPFADMVRRLHPTAALGVTPRTEAGERWLRETDRNVRRRTFGAPFGLEREDHSALALVSIRNVHWKGSHVRIGSGAGQLPESVLEREFEELRQKREQVKSMFGLAQTREAQSAAS